ncbi:MAG: hypothetical protein IJN80_02615 [Clostridia bacterium]|nr:hypothetical protein [Clostridia bacterium]
MKKKISYYKIKWTAFLLTISALLMGLAIIWLNGQQTMNDPISEKQPDPAPIIEHSAGHYSNQAFSQLLERNLSELGFLSQIQFEGKEEGHFSVSGVLSNPDRLAAACPDLSAFESLLTALKDEKITIQGHLAEAENGTGRIIADTITFSGHTLPAGAATPYIEQYTAVNDLFAVPYDQISVTNDGVTFLQELPASIQTA